MTNSILPDTYQYNQECPVKATLEVIGGKWKGVILYHLLEKPYRPGDLRRAMPGITPPMLTRQLRELEVDGIIDRKVFPEVPPKVEYSVTELGESLREIVALMHGWGMKHFTRQNGTECFGTASGHKNNY